MQTQRNNNKERRRVAGKLAIKTLSKLDSKLFSTIAERRKMRATPIVMIADDDKISRTLASNVLKNYDWVCVQDGRHALTEYTLVVPDVLILDIGLPDINGHEVLKCIFQIDPDAYVVMFSQYRDEKNILQSVEEGAQGFVGKPFSRDKLFQYINRSPHIREKLKRKING